MNVVRAIVTCWYSAECCVMLVQSKEIYKRMIASTWRTKKMKEIFAKQMIQMNECE